MKRVERQSDFSPARSSKARPTPLRHSRRRLAGLPPAWSIARGRSSARSSAAIQPRPELRGPSSPCSSPPGGDLLSELARLDPDGAHPARSVPAPCALETTLRTGRRVSIRFLWEALFIAPATPAGSSCTRPAPRTVPWTPVPQAFGVGSLNSVARQGLQRGWMCFCSVSR